MAGGSVWHVSLSLAVAWTTIEPHCLHSRKEMTLKDSTGWGSRGDLLRNLISPVVHVRPAQPLKHARTREKTFSHGGEKEEMQRQNLLRAREKIYA